MLFTASVALMLAAPAPSAPDGGSLEATKTFVLVHGVGTGGWLWDAVATELKARGHRVITPSLAGAEGGSQVAPSKVTLAVHIAELRRVIEGGLADRVVLVGFGAGGLVASAVSSMAPERVEALIYLDGYLPAPGKSMLDLLPAPMRAQTEKAAEALGGELVPPPTIEQLGGLGALDGPTEGEVLIQLARRKPWPFAIYKDIAPPSTPAVAKIPKTYIYCKGKTGIDPLRNVAEFSKKAGFQSLELEAGHFPMLTMPKALASMLDGAVKP